MGAVVVVEAVVEIAVVVIKVVVGTTVVVDYEDGAEVVGATVVSLLLLIRV